MGQAPASLESLSIVAIQNRVLATPPLERFMEAYSASRGGWRAPGLLPGLSLPANINVPPLTDPEKALIKSLSIDPSDTTLDDLGIIDGFFGGLTPELCDVMNGKRSSAFGRGQPSAAQAIHTWMTYSTPGRGLFSGTPPNAPPAEQEAIRSNPFFCGSPMEFPEVVYERPKHDYAGWFGIDSTGTWGSVKLQVQNAITVMSVVSSYPFPPPLDLQDKAAFWILSIGDIREIVRTPEPVNPEAVRIWITMTILANYSNWVDMMAAEEKKSAKKAKRKALMKTIGLVVASIVAAFILPAVIAVIASAIKTAVTTYIDAQKRRKAAQDMANASKMFADDAPAFSKEVDHAAQVLDEQAALQEAAMTPSPEVQAAIDQVKAETGPAWGTILPIGGGIAAAGLAAFAIFK